MKQYKIDETTISEFEKLFMPKAEYLAAIKGMSLKERAFDWKPSNRVEELVKTVIIDKALVKTGAGALRVTSYLLHADASSATAYISYGGKQLKLTMEGRDNDVGGFFRATPDGDGIQVSVQTQYERHRGRYIAGSLGGCLLFFVPGLLIGATFLLIHSKTATRLERTVIPAIDAALREPKTS